MKIHIDHGEATLSGIERLSSDNAAEFEQEMLKLTDDVHKVVLDADGLSYISSAGLRVLLKLKKKYELSVVNVSTEIFGIFEITGFQEMMPVKLKRRQISVDGCEMIGRGSRGIVYKIDKDTAVKVFSTGIGLPVVENERELTKNALIAGVPAMIPFDICDCGGRLAIVYELVSGGDYTVVIKENPEKRERIIRDYAVFVKGLNRIVLPADRFKSQKAAYLDILKKCSDKLDREEYYRYEGMLQALPDGHCFVHGDCHMKNIMTSDRGNTIIDLEGCGYGHFILELIAICCDYKLPGLPMFLGMKDFVVEMTMGFNKAQCLDIWNIFFNEYMEDKKNLQDIDELCTVYAYLRHTLNALLNPLLAPDFIIDQMKEYIRKVTSGDLCGYKRLLGEYHAELRNS